MSIGGVARGGLFLFIGSVLASILGYIYWFLVSVIGGTEVIGIASSVDSLSTLVANIAILGIPAGVQRFLGRYFGRKDAESLGIYFWSTLYFTLILCLISAFAIWAIPLLNLSFIFKGFSEAMLISTGFIISLSFSGIAIALFASIIKTEYIAISYVVSSVTKLGSGVFLVYMGLGWLGAVIGLIVSGLSLILLMLFFASKELRRLGVTRMRLSFKALRESVHAGFASWLPGVVALLGQQLSLLTVFGLQGGIQAGTYFIAFVIFGIVYTLPSSFTYILFPILSGADDGGRETAWRVLKLSLALACPSTVFLVFYSGFPLSLMGGDYVQAAPTLSLLALSTIPLTFISAVNSLVYASGHYGRVLGIGLAINIPRVILYFVLVPLYSGYGAALSFLIGSLTGLGVAVYVSKEADFKVSSKAISVAIAGPLVAATISLVLGLDWLIGGMVIMLVSVICYGRLGVVERDDLMQIARAFASEKTIAKASERLGWILRIIYGE